LNDTGRISSLDGLRGIAAVAVMLFHFHYFFLPQAHLSEILPGLGHAYLGVDLFFLMSGFVMAHAYGAKLALDWRKNWWEFTVARFARLYPLFITATLLMVATAALSGMSLTGILLSRRTLLLQPLMLQFLAPGLSWNYPSWSISTETVSYVLFVFSAGLLVGSYYPRLIAALCFAILLSISISHGGSLHLFSGPSSLLRTLAEFTLGALVHRACCGDSHSYRRFAALIAIALLLLAAFTHWDILVVAAFGFLIYNGVHDSSVLARVLSARPAIALGDYSYSIYLLHAPIHYAIMAICASRGYSLTKLSPEIARIWIGMTSLVVIGLSALAFNYFELPIRRWILRTLLSRRQAEDHANSQIAKTSVPVPHAPKS
jgi:peptidoglycan/LPS O-acetylase OafA/YrhL